MLRHTQLDGDASHMGVDDYSVRFPHGYPEYNIGGLPSDAGKFDELLEGGRQIALMLFDEVTTAALNGLGFLAEKSGSADGLFDVLDWCFREGLGSGEEVEQRRRDDVHSGIGTLGAEDGRNEQLERAVVMKAALGIGILLAQDADDIAEAFFASIEIEHGWPFTTDSRVIESGLVFLTSPRGDASLRIPAGECTTALHAGPHLEYGAPLAQLAEQLTLNQ